MGVVYLLFSLFQAHAADHWVGTWGTAPQLVESNNNPPSPGLQNNSLRQIVQVSIGGDVVRLKLTNEFSSGATQIKAVEIARAATAGSSSDIDESSSVSLTFDGSASATMAAGATAVSDPVAFHMDPRENVAITIHYGTASSTSVSGHPGSRTTSYLKTGNTTDFSGATKTEHWYNILALEVMAPEEAGAVAILGNSITDGRGSTTNQQNRWADVLSRRLLQNEATSQVAVLNMGIGGNCVLSGGLGPTASSRYKRDLLGQEGVKWIILFEAVNDLGGAANGEQTAQRIIDVYKQIIREAHAKGIRVFGATITPFKNNSYYSASHEQGRQKINNWILSTKMLDGTIDFAAAVCNPQDPEALQQQFLFQNDWLHLNATGYETMGGAVDLSLFTQTGPLAADEDDDEGQENPLEGIWIEAESLVTSAAGYNFRDILDASASEGHYLETYSNIVNAAPTDSADLMVMRFDVKTAGTYYIYGRVNCPTWDDDSYWLKMDQGQFAYVNGLCTNGSWEWKQLWTGSLAAGQHALTIGCREDGARLDKLFVTTSATAPTGMGGSANPVVQPDDPKPGDQQGDAKLTSTLPVFVITTETAINADAKVKGTMKVVSHVDGSLNHDNDEATDYDGFIGIKLRGNSSLSFAQKKYSIETRDEAGNDVKVPLLGMPEESDWVLLAPYNDISLVRDVFAFNMWTEMGHWAPRTRMCEVIVNGEYQGVYIFCEKIKRDKDRVDIAKLKETDVEGREVTGGYILRIDAVDDDKATFTSKQNGLPENSYGGGGWGGWPWGGGTATNNAVTWTVFHPKKDKLQDAQLTYIHNFVDQMEQSFQEANFADPDEGYAKWIDVPSFVDYFIHTELSLNADGFKRSSYFYKDKDDLDGTMAKMKAGPVWDYNLAYGDCNFCNANNVESWVYEGCTTNPTPSFWKKLTTDPAFMKQVRERYAQLRHTIISQESINAFFDSYAELLDEAKDRHYAKYSDLLVDPNSQQGGGGWGWGWPGMGGTTSPVSYFAAYFVSSYEEEIKTVKEWFQKRLAFLDKQWSYDPTSGVTGVEVYFNVDVRQNDSNHFTVRSNRKLSRVEVYSLSGRQLLTSDYRQGRSKVQVVVPTRDRGPLVLVCRALDGSFITRKLR